MNISTNYFTKKNYPRSIFDRLAMGSSSYFLANFLFKLIGNRKLAISGKYDTPTWASRSNEIFKLIEDCGGKFFVEGLENINKTKQPVVFVSNHMSMLESMILPGLIAPKREVTFVVKKSLTTHPLFGPVMRARHPIAVERKKPAIDFKRVMEEGIDKLKNNISVVIFPQSQRSVEFDPLQFNKMGIKLAKKANVPIIPIAIKTDFWKNGKLIKDLGGINRKEHIHIKFGEPIQIKSNGNVEHQNIINFISQQLNKWNK